MLQLEINLTDRQFEELTSFLELVGLLDTIEWKIRDRRSKLELIKDLTEERKEQLHKEIAFLENEYSKQKFKVMAEISEARKVLQDKETQLIEWAEEIWNFYLIQNLTATPRPKDEKELNSLREEYFQSERYKNKLEEKVNKKILRLKNIDLTPSQQIKIKNTLMDFEKKIDNLKAQLTALQYVPYINKSGNEIINDINQLIKLRDHQIKTYLTKEQILKLEQLK